MVIQFTKMKIQYKSNEINKLLFRVISELCIDSDLLYTFL